MLRRYRLNTLLRSLPVPVAISAMYVPAGKLRMSNSHVEVPTGKAANDCCFPLMS